MQKLPFSKLVKHKYTASQWAETANKSEAPCKTFCKPTQFTGELFSA